MRSNFFLTPVWCWDLDFNTDECTFDRHDEAVNWVPPPLDCYEMLCEHGTCCIESRVHIPRMEGHISRQSPLAACSLCRLRSVSVARGHFPWASCSMVPLVFFSSFVTERQDDGNGNAYKRFPSGSFLHIGKTKGGGKRSGVTHLLFSNCWG